MAFKPRRGTDVAGTLARERSLPMSLPQLIILAVVAMIGIASLRVTRVHLGRSPLPAGKGRLPFLLAFVIVPPLLLDRLIAPGSTASEVSGAPAVLLYGVILLALVVLMWIAAVIAQIVAPGRWRPLLLLALIGREVDPGDAPLDPPVTAQLAASMAIVDGANAAFVRGPGFAAEIGRPGFRDGWDALDTATAALESQIADDRRLGLGAASEATATARDARGRLDTLRRLAEAEEHA
jgi:hypothetical protein